MGSQLRASDGWNETLKTRVLLAETGGRQACVGMAAGDFWGTRVMQTTQEGEETRRVIGKAPEPWFLCWVTTEISLSSRAGNQVGKKRPGCFQHYKQPWNAEHWKFKSQSWGYWTIIYGECGTFSGGESFSVENWPGPLDFPLNQNPQSCSRLSRWSEETKPWEPCLRYFQIKWPTGILYDTVDKIYLLKNILIKYAIFFMLSKRSLTQIWILYDSMYTKLEKKQS